MTDSAIIDFAQRIKARDSVAAANIGQAAVAPDQAARSNALSRDMDLQPEFVDRNLGAIEKQALAIKARDAIAKYPTIGMWASDPRHAAVGADDMAGLSKVAKVFNGLTPSSFSQNRERSRASDDPLLAASNQATGTPAPTSAALASRYAIAVHDMVARAQSSAGDGVTGADLAALPEQAARAVPAGALDLTSGLYGVGRGFAEVGDKISPVSMAERAIFGASMYSKIAELFQRQQDVGSALADQVGGAPARNRYMRDVVSGIRSVPMSAGALGLSAMGAPEAGAGLIAASVGGQSYKTARDAGVDPIKAFTYASSQGLVEFATERLPAIRYFEDTKAGAGFVKKLAHNLATEMPQEQVATVLQDMNDWAVLHPDKSLGDYIVARPSAALSTAIATAVGGVVSVGSAEAVAKVATGAAKVAVKRQDAAQAETDATFLDQLSKGVTDSKTAKRDPSAFAKFLALQAQGTPVENIYVPGDKVAEYFQSNDMDWHDSGGGFDFDPAFAAHVDEALATGGDVVMKTSDFAAHLAGTPAWDALKDHVRLSPGGMSLSEAKDFASGHDEAMTKLGEEYAAQTEADQASIEPRQNLYQSIRDKLTNAGFTQSAADTNASLLTARYATRAARRGVDITGKEFDPVEVKQVLPEKLAPYAAVDQLDVVINAMKRDRGQRSAAQKFGPSLLEWISSQGGIEDKGGDLKAMGADKWHVGKPGKRRLIRAHEQDGPTLVPMGKLNANTPDELALRAQEAGYLPAGERPSIDALHEAIANELHGKPVYAEDRSGKTDEVRQAADELAALLDQEGLDPATAGAGDIRKAVARYQAEAMGGIGYDQSQDGAVLARALENMGDNEAVITKALVDRAGFSPQELGNVAVSAAKLSEADGLGRIPPLAAMLALMRRIVLAEPKVLNAIVELVPVDMVNDLFGSKAAAKVALHNNAVDENSPAFDGNLVVAGGADTARAVRLLLVKAAIQTAKASDVAFRAARGSFEGGAAKVAGVTRQLNDSPVKRASIRFSPDLSTITINLFEKRDVSSFLHESGHLWLEELRHDAEADGATDQIKADWQQVQDWFKANGHAVADGVIPIDAHEMWARGVERFLMEGKAPSSALRRVFDTFRSWLVSIYHVVNNLRAPITPEIRDVMSRLIATDAEIQSAGLDQQIKTMFDDAATAGMTGPQFDAYRQLANDARDEAFDALLFRTMAKVRRERTNAWKDERDSVKAEVTARVDAQPEFRALAMLRGPDGIKLDRAWLVETYGDDGLALIPKSVPPIYAEKNTTSADQIAEMNGFSSGDEMVRALMGIGQRTQQLREAGDKRSARVSIIDDEVAAIMRDRHGDPLSDGSIEEETLTLIHNEKQGEVIASELRQLAKQSNRTPTPYSLAREWARDTIAQSKVSDSLSGAALQRYAKAARNAATLAQEAMLKGDADETYRQKQRQMLNNALIDEAGKAKALIDAAVTKLGKVAKRATMKSVDQDYLEQAHALLEQVEFRRRPQVQIARKESFEKWAAQRQAEGYDVVVPPSFADMLGKDNWSRLTVENLLGLRDAVDQILHLGRQKQTLIDNKKLRDFRATVDEGLGQIDGGGRDRVPTVKDFREPGYFDRAKSMVLGAHAAMLKMETVFDWLDQGKIGGVFNRIVFQPMVDAQEKRRLMMKDIHAQLDAALKKVPKEQRARWGDKASLDLIDKETGKPAVMDRGQLITMALNMGNEGNADKLARGHGWDEGAILATLNARLSPAEWQYVQDTWDVIDTLWPQIEALERRVNGVAPPKVDARPVDTLAGVLRGGYYPVVYDPSRSGAVEKVNSESADQLFSSGYRRASTRAGSTHERTQVANPILLSFSVLSRHVSEVIHDITHREALMQAHKFLNDPAIVKAVRETEGVEVQKQFNPWLHHIANEFAYEANGTAAIERMIKGLRTNATFVGMAYRGSTMVMQLAGLSNSAEVMKFGWVADGLYRFIKNPIASTDFVLAHSQEVAARMANMDRDINDAIKREQSKVGFISDFKAFGYHGIGYVDRLVSVITWTGAYNKGLSEKMPDAQAMAYADKVVRQSQGSGSAKDLAAIQRGRGTAGEATKLLTMFYSYMSTFYQRQVNINRDTATAIKGRAYKDFPRLLARVAFLYFIPSLLSELLAGRGPDDDEDYAAWIAKTVGIAALGPLPIVRDVAGGIASGFGYTFTPASGLGRTAVNLWKDGEHIWNGEDTKRATRDVMEGLGYLGAPISGQMAATTQFIIDAADGDQDPEGLAEWWRGIRTGKAAKP